MKQEIRRAMTAPALVTQGRLCLSGGLRGQSRLLTNGDRFLIRSWLRLWATLYQPLTRAFWLPLTSLMDQPPLRGRHRTTPGAIPKLGQCQAFIKVEAEPYPPSLVSILLFTVPHSAAMLAPKRTQLYGSLLRIHPWRHELRRKLKHLAWTTRPFTLLFTFPRSFLDHHPNATLSLQPSEALGGPVLQSPRTLEPPRQVLVSLPELPSPQPTLYSASLSLSFSFFWTELKCHHPQGPFPV